MAIKDLSKIDDRLNKIYENQTTTNTSTNYIDKSDILLEQMQFLAAYNKSLIKFK